LSHVLRTTLCEHVNGLCPAEWLTEQSITKHWLQSVGTCPYSWAAGRNTVFFSLVMCTKKSTVQCIPNDLTTRFKLELLLLSTRHRTQTQGVKDTFSYFTLNVDLRIFSLYTWQANDLTK